MPIACQSSSAEHSFTFSKPSQKCAQLKFTGAAPIWPVAAAVLHRSPSWSRLHHFAVTAQCPREVPERGSAEGPTRGLGTRSNLERSHCGVCKSSRARALDSHHLDAHAAAIHHSTACDIILEPWQCLECSVGLLDRRSPLASLASALAKLQRQTRTKVPAWSLTQGMRASLKAQGIRTTSEIESHTAACLRKVHHLRAFN